MVIKDLKININTTSLLRYDWLRKEMANHPEEEIILIGESLYIKDIVMQDIHKFVNFLENHKDRRFLIQDIDTLSHQMLKREGKSLYTAFKRVSNVSLFVNLDEVELSSEALRKGMTYPEDTISDVGYHNEMIDFNSYIELQKEHEEDIIGVFIEEILNSDKDNIEKVDILDKGIEALLRR